MESNAVFDSVQLVLELGLVQYLQQFDVADGIEHMCAYLRSLPRNDPNRLESILAEHAGRHGDPFTYRLDPSGQFCYDVHLEAELQDKIKEKWDNVAMPSSTGVSMSVGSFLDSTLSIFVDGNLKRLDEISRRTPSSYVCS